MLRGEYQYALDDKGEQIEAYFHPVTLERVPIAGE